MKINNNHIFKKAQSKQIELGRQVQIDYPDIVNEYRDIKNGIDDIVLNIMNKYNLSDEKIAEGALYRALLYGYDGKGSFVKISRYDGLISARDFLDTSLQRKFYRNS